MPWFKHHHYWRPKTDLNRVMDPDNLSIARGGLIIEDCSCGAVRTIEFEPGKAPVIRIGVCYEAPDARCRARSDHQSSRGS